MIQAAPTLLLTRPRPQAEAFLTACQSQAKRPFQFCVSPILEIRDVGDLPDLTGTGTVVVTSSNAVRRLGGALNEKNVAVVGDATAQLAQSLGATVLCVADTASDLLALTDCLIAPVLVCRGLHARVDLNTELNARGVHARSVVIYEQVANPLSSEAHRVLTGSRPVVAPLFSPRTASLLSTEKITAPLAVVALSPAVAQAWTGPGDVSVSKAPNADAMRDLVVSQL